MFVKKNSKFTIYSKLRYSSKLSRNSGGWERRAYISPAFFDCPSNSLVYSLGRLGLEYTDCIPSRRRWIHPHPKKSNVLRTTLNWIWWWGSNYGNLGNMEYSFIAITTWFTLMRSGSTFRTNTLGNGITPPYPTNSGLNRTTTIVL